jgi:hypothetical protein
MSIKFIAFFRGALHWTLTSDISFNPHSAFHQAKAAIEQPCNATERKLFTNSHWHNSTKITVFRDTTLYSLAGTNYSEEPDAPFF